MSKKPLFIEALLAQHNLQRDKALKVELDPEVEKICKALLVLYSKSEAEYYAYLEKQFPSDASGAGNSTENDECRAAFWYLLMCKKAIHTIMSKKDLLKKKKTATKV